MNTINMIDVPTIRQMLRLTNIHNGDLIRVRLNATDEGTRFGVIYVVVDEQRTGTMEAFQECLSDEIPTAQVLPVPVFHNVQYESDKGHIQDIEKGDHVFVHETLKWYVLVYPEKLPDESAFLICRE